MSLTMCLNFIKVNALNSRLFAELRKESDSEFVTLLLHSHVRWLPKGKVLKRVFIFRQEMKDFLQGPKPELHQNFQMIVFGYVFHFWWTFWNLLILSIRRYKERRLISFIVRKSCRHST